MLFNDWIRNHYFSSWWCHGVMLYLRHWDLSFPTPWEVRALNMMWKSINCTSLTLSLWGAYRCITCWWISLESFHVIRRSLSNCIQNWQGGPLRKFTNFLDLSQPSCNTAARKGFSCIILWCAPFGTWLDSGKTENWVPMFLSAPMKCMTARNVASWQHLAVPSLTSFFKRTFAFESRRPFTLWAMPIFIVLLCFLWL